MKTAMGYRVFFGVLLIPLVIAQSEFRVPDPPENVKIKTESTKATLWWEPPSTASDVLVRGYTVSYGVESPSTKIVIEGVDTNVFTIENLKPNTKYVFAMTAYNEAEDEDSEKVLLTARTEALMESHFRLQSPVEVKVVPLSPGEVEVFWKDPVPEGRDENRVDFVGKRRFYILQYSENRNHPKKVTTEKNKILLTNLSPDTDYEIMVRTVLPDGKESPWSQREFYRTPSSSTREIPFFNQNPTSDGEFCDFETTDLCDYFNEATAPLKFRRQTPMDPPRNRNGGHFVTVETTKNSDEKFGRFMSPVWNFGNEKNFCLNFWIFLKTNSIGILTVSLLHEGDSMNLAFPIFKSKLEKLQRGFWHEISIEHQLRRERSFQLVIEVRKTSLRSHFWIAVDDIRAKGGSCPGNHKFHGIVAGWFFLFKVHPGAYLFEEKTKLEKNPEAITQISSNVGYCRPRVRFFS